MSKVNDVYLQNADEDFCMNTIKEANQRGDNEVAAAYAQRLLYLQLEKLNKKLIMDENKKQEIKDYLKDFSIEDLKEVISIAEVLLSETAFKGVDEVDMDNFEELSAACESLLDSLPDNESDWITDELSDIADLIGAEYMRYETVDLSNVFWQINNYDCSDEDRLTATQLLFEMLKSGITAVHYDW